MNLKPVFLLALIFLLSGTVVADYTPLSHMRLGVGGTEQFQVKLGNPLSEPDNIFVEFKGTALEGEPAMVSVDIVEDEERVQQDLASLDECDLGGSTRGCCTGELDCKFRVSAGQEKIINYEVKADLSTSQDEAELIAEVAFETYQGTNRDSVTIMTDPVDRDGVVKSTALTYPFLLGLFFLAGFSYMFYKS